MIKEILQIGNPVLREASEDVTVFNSSLNDLVTDLRDTIIDFQKQKGMGRGIAAPQIGVLKKVIFLMLPDRELTLVNPEIIVRSDEMMEVWDSCFSFDVAFFVKTNRHKTITVKFQDAQGGFYEKSFTDDLSELLQHEIDHLHGILATDRQMSKHDIIMRSEWEKLPK